MTWISADDAHDAMTPNDLAVAANLLYRSQYFHVVPFSVQLSAISKPVAHALTPLLLTAESG